ncbi:hypothetical protein RND81_02G214000 [Saponaria officinalis]|uniref:Peptidase A1 domain-containing protein n=1 Tax=Saponaria officinalis TaxID=3572 RepID=A0AAW1MVB3_SAPOF
MIIHNSNQPRRISPLVTFFEGATNSFFSIPKQLFPDNPKFSYCIPSDLAKTSLIKFGDDANLAGNPIKVLRHPKRHYYYLDVYGIQINREDINVEPSLFKMKTDGDGYNGFIIDSGTVYTILPSLAFDALKDKVYKFLGTPTQYKIFEICYSNSIFGGIWPFKSMPTVGIKFWDSTVFEFDINKSWFKMHEANLDCLYVLRQRQDINLTVLGSAHLYDINVGHDLKNDLLYLLRMTCPTQ